MLDTHFSFVDVTGWCQRFLVQEGSMTLDLGYDLMRPLCQA